MDDAVTLRLLPLSFNPDMPRRLNSDAALAAFDDEPIAVPDVELDALPWLAFHASLLNPLSRPGERRRSQRH